MRAFYVFNCQQITITSSSVSTIAQTSFFDWNKLTSSSAPVLLERSFDSFGKLYITTYGAVSTFAEYSTFPQLFLGRRQTVCFQCRPNQKGRVLTSL